MKIGDWVYFQTRNWPKDSALVKAEHDSDEGLYTGSGKIVGIVGNHITVREEKTDFLVEVGPHPDDRVFPFTCDYQTLTLGHLRQFLDQHKNVPDDTPVTIALPLSYFGDLQKLPLDHPQYKEVFECEVVYARAISIAGFSSGEDYTDNYIPPAEWDDEVWEFTVEITPHPAQCFDASRRPENE